MRVAVIMCIYKRLGRLPITLNLLNTQTYKNFDLYIWNNSLNKDIKISYQNYNYKINVYNSFTNIGGFGRFYYANMIYKDYDKIIFIDDDQEFDSTLIETFINESELNSICSWWSWKILGQYTNRTRCKSGELAHYTGTGGMILDAKIFADNMIFECPKEYWFIEDLWLSYFANSIYKWKLYGSKYDKMKIIEDGNDQYVNLMTKKNDFLNYLKSRGWKI